MKQNYRSQCFEVVKAYDLSGKVVRLTSQVSIASILRGNRLAELLSIVHDTLEALKYSYEAGHHRMRI
jgi:hypothetical protein